MAEVFISLKDHGFEKISAELEDLLYRVQNPGTEIMGHMAEYMVRSTRQRIDSGRRVDPDGEPWPSLSYTTISIRRNRGYGYKVTDPLRQFGVLKRSIEVGQVSNNDFEVGTNLEYAELLQEGGVTAETSRLPGRYVPPRPFLGFSDTNIRRLTEMLGAYIMEHDLLGGGDE